MLERLLCEVRKNVQLRAYMVKKALENRPDLYEDPLPIFMTTKIFDGEMPPTIFEFRDDGQWSILDNFLNQDTGYRLHVGADWVLRAMAEKAFEGVEPLCANA